MKKIGCLLILAFLLPSFGQAKPKGLFLVELRDAKVLDAIRLIAKAENTNVLVPDQLEGKITTSFNQIALTDALKAILASFSYDIVDNFGVKRVTELKEIEKTGSDLITKTFYLKYSGAQSVLTQVSKLNTQRGSTVIDERTNAVSVRDTKQVIANINELITNIDRPDEQVLIEARIVEASSDFAQNLGLEWGLSYGSDAVDVNRSLPLATRALSVAARPGGNFSLDVALNAAEEQGKIKIISRPSIVTSNNQAATISSGFKFYVRTPGDLNISSSESSEGGATDGDTSNEGKLQEISAGISMVVTPQITHDNRVSLKIHIVESQPDFAKAIDGIPSILDNSANTSVWLENGETTVIAGLFQSHFSQFDKGLPFLRRIPILGPFVFGSQQQGKINKELVIFITPKIIENSKTSETILRHQNLSKDKDN